MNILSLPFNHGSIAALERIRQKISGGIYTVIGHGYLDRKPAYFGDYQTFFVRISDGFGLFLFHAEISPESIRVRIQTDVRVTCFLDEKQKMKKLHPIVQPVRILSCGLGDAPYICKSIPGKAGFPFPEDDVHAVRVFQLFRAFITDNLSELKINTGGAGYDIHGDNVVFNDVFIQLVENSRDIAHLIDEWAFLPECDNERKALVDEWAEKGARIHLFDFGSWILPEPK